MYEQTKIMNLKGWKYAAGFATVITILSFVAVVLAVNGIGFRPFF